MSKYLVILIEIIFIKKLVDGDDDYFCSLFQI